jgi:hypothetical protein
MGHERGVAAIDELGRYDGFEVVSGARESPKIRLCWKRGGSPKMFVAVVEFLKKRVSRKRDLHDWPQRGRKHHAAPRF